MAKRRTIGAIFKSKDPKNPDYIKIDPKLEGGALTLKAGSFVRVETQAYQMESLDQAEADGKLSGDVLEKLRARVEKMPEFIRAELVILE